MNIALTGMSRNMRSIETAARNVANVNTDGYRAQRYDPASGTTRPRYDDPVPDDGADPETLLPSDVDLTTELVDIKRYEIGYRANAVVLVVADRMAGELLDMFG
jgi:flagellar hook protein FlgE